MTSCHLGIHRQTPVYICYIILSRQGFHSVLLGLPHDNAVFALSLFEHNFPHKNDKSILFLILGGRQGADIFCTNTYK